MDFGGGASLLSLPGKNLIVYESLGFIEGYWKFF